MVRADNDLGIGPNAAISSRVKMDYNVFVTFGSMVTKDVLEGEKVSGNFAIPHRLFLKHIKNISACEE